MPEASGEARWYALKTKSRHEKLVRDRLAGQGIEPLLPTIIRLSQWKDRRKEIVVPLFSGYCFAQFPWSNRLAVQKTSGVVEIVGGGDRPEPIPDKEIEAVQQMQDHQARALNHPDHWSSRLMYRLLPCLFRTGLLQWLQRTERQQMSEGIVPVRLVV